MQDDRFWGFCDQLLHPPRNPIKKTNRTRKNEKGHKIAPHLLSNQKQPKIAAVSSHAMGIQLSQPEENRCGVKDYT